MTDIDAYSSFLLFSILSRLRFSLVHLVVDGIGICWENGIGNGEGKCLKGEKKIDDKDENRDLDKVMFVDQVG